MKALRTRAVSVAATVVLGLACLSCSPNQDTSLTVGSKKFTESVILGDIVTLTLRTKGLVAKHKRQLGGTRVLWNALLSGEIDVYPEYTGTIRKEIFGHSEPAAGLGALIDALAAKGVSVAGPLGFENNYALGMRQARAESLGVTTVSDLRTKPGIRFGFTNEFMDRSDGWPGLARSYGLESHKARGLDHDLAYKAILSGGIDVMDLYTTDAEIAQHKLRVLDDDHDYFPSYSAVILYRTELAENIPAMTYALATLTGSIDSSTMVAMNAAAKIDRVAETEVARRFVTQHLGTELTVVTRDRFQRILDRTREHLWLVGVSLGAAILVALPLGIVAARHSRVGQVLLAAAGVFQTIPALALLVFMIPLLGIGGPPAIAALFLYSILPILRNTHTGLCSVPAPLAESAEALGLTNSEKLRWIELPMASPAILAGIKTSAVINIGTATLGALIGAGGYGQPILTGIRLDDTGLILEGAVPAALLALAVQVLFELAERVLVPAGLRQASD